MGANLITSATLVAAPQRLRFGNVEVAGMTYNGTYSGPLLRVKPGGELRIRLINHLDEPTNLHFHGILASPTGNSDNVFIMVNPGESFDYKIRIPLTQSPGLYWYHTHEHGLTERQVMRGLSGPLLVEGFANRVPGLAGIAERVLALKEITLRRRGAPTVRDEWHGSILTINGETDSLIQMRPGETQLWHLGNFGPNRPFRFGIAGHKLRIVGRDGTVLVHESAVDSITVDPGSRYEVLIEAGDLGRFPIYATSVSTGKGRETREQVMGNVVVEGPRALPLVTEVKSAAANDLRNAKIDAYRTVVFSDRGREYLINGRAFDPKRIDLRVPLGNTEEWTIRNESDELHVFHIHQVNFQVVEVNGLPEPFNNRIDTVGVRERGSIKIRIAFTQPQIVGRFVFHCHVLEHEDRGMMARIEVYDPRLPHAR